MLDLLGGRAITLADLPPADEDWYANLLWLDRQKCLLFTHAATLFSVFLARVVSHLGREDQVDRAATSRQVVCEAERVILA